jgi:lipoprotein-anchoring transpeptidase ErfK/SrfK
MPAFSFSRLINLAGAVLIGSATLLGAGRAEAASQMVARISISAQRMLVLVDGREAFSWKVSTAGRGYSTPTGTFRPTRLHEMWYSRQYDNAPMPHSVFFFQGYAVHATDAVKKLGRPASHGCVRLHPDNAADFFTLVETFGIANTAIVITE